MSAPWKPQVYLVGAGPGDPGLLTRRAAALLRRANIVFHDALIHPRTLALIGEGVERVAVGKRAGGIGPKQGEINEMMVAAARAGKTVVRLKGGDPFVFGRGGEEMTALADAGIRFEVVPGVTSACAVPAMIGIPLTMRGLSSVVHIVTGHEDPADREGPVDWDIFRRPGHTVVVLMGSAHLIEILKRLAANGMDASTPLAVIHWGSLAQQRSLRGTLGEALAEPGRYSLPSPALAVIGAVAGMDASLNWFEQRPLFGRRVLLTRPESAGWAMLEALEEAGADAENVAVIRTVEGDRDEDARLVEWVERLRARAGWLVLPSGPAIRFLFAALERLGLDARALAGIRVAVLSPAAGGELRRHGVFADFVPDRANGERMAATLPVEGERPLVVVAGSDISRPELRQALEARGIETGHHALYGTQVDDAAAREAVDRIEAGGVHDVVVFSPSAVAALAKAAGSRKRLARARWWAIGSTTAAALRNAGFDVTGEAAAPTPEALVEALCGIPGASTDRGASG
jgi:uroporphyrinogen III methyltransferase / synthase